MQMEDEGGELVRHEEQLVVGAESVVQVVRLRTEVRREGVEEAVPRRFEDLEQTGRVPAAEQDSGEVETLPDGSISIPILEEELVVTRRVVVRERVILRKRVDVEQQVVRAELSGERLVIERDPAGEA
jgi:stress response protein YsnF